MKHPSSQSLGGIFDGSVYRSARTKNEYDICRAVNGAFIAAGLL